MPPERIWMQPVGVYILMSYIKLKVMYHHICASLRIIPLSCMRKCGQDPIHSKLGSMNMMVLFSLLISVCKETG